MQLSTSQPLVSVIIPTFNRATWVCEAIASVLAQTYAHLELIVVDDGSHDATPEVVQAFGEALMYIRQAHAGVSAARNRGVAASRGALVAFLDSDDTVASEENRGASSPLAATARRPGLLHGRNLDPPRRAGECQADPSETQRLAL